MRETTFLNMLARQRFSLDHSLLLQSLCTSSSLLIIQDLDGVCMELVRNPLTRTLATPYILAAKQLQRHFFVLTNGEHVGKLGVNQLVDKALGNPLQARQQGLYLPGLGGGGVQWQTALGEISYPGVSAAELEFLGTVSPRMTEVLRTRLAQAPFNLHQQHIESILAQVILDNPVSPTVNINALVNELGRDWPHFQALQQILQHLLQDLLQLARHAGLGDAFFAHYAPNLGRGPDGERLQPASQDSLGSTDFQFMLQGAVKEVGVLVLLNQYYHQHHGHYPLGETFNARQAPRDQTTLLQLAADHFDPALMPRIVAVGDTLTSQATTSQTHLRGGSDRGFLQLVQQLGQQFNSDNAVLFVDSSGGELQRPTINTAQLDVEPWQALAGITDAQDPLQLNFLFPGGHRQYIQWFCQLAASRN